MCESGCLVHRVAVRARQQKVCKNFSTVTDRLELPVGSVLKYTVVDCVHNQAEASQE